MQMGACFAKGTYILTENGNVLIEELQAGDKVATVLWNFVPVKWIGRRRIDFHAPSEAAGSNRPILISKSSLADQVPCEDLLLSKAHAVLCHGLRLAGNLVNGSDIREVYDLDEIIYYHVELDQYDFIVANGLAVESYDDCGNRKWFDNYPEWLCGSLGGQPPTYSEKIVRVLRPAAASIR